MRNICIYFFLFTFKWQVQFLAHGQVNNCLQSWSDLKHPPFLLSHMPLRRYVNNNLMGYCKKDVTPVRYQWSCIFLALTHPHDNEISNVFLHYWPSIACKVTLDISSSPIFKGAPGNIQGNLDGTAVGGCHWKVIFCTEGKFCDLFC